MVVSTSMVFHFMFSIIANTQGWKGIEPIFSRSAADIMEYCMRLPSMLFIFVMSILIEFEDWTSKLARNMVDETNLTKK